MTLADLKNKSLSELETIYQNPFPQQAPESGIYHGSWLKRIDSPGARNLLYAIPQFILFDLLPYGIEFHATGGTWFYLHNSLKVGTFRTETGTSRFRDTLCTRLIYDKSDLPSPVRGLLYDEVKVMQPGLLLGLGALNLEKGQGDHFYFALQKQIA